MKRRVASLLGASALLASAARADIEILSDIRSIATDTQTVSYRHVDGEDLYMWTPPGLDDEYIVSHKKLGQQTVNQYSSASASKISGSGNAYVQFFDKEIGAWGESNFQLVFDLKTARSYNFDAGCTGGQKNDNVRFSGPGINFYINGLASEDDPARRPTEGVIGPGRYVIEAHCYSKGRADWQASSWHFQLDIGDETFKKYFTEFQRWRWGKCADAVGYEAWGIVSAAAAARKPYSWFLVAVGNLYYGASAGLRQLSLDPPDSNYAPIYLPESKPVPAPPQNDASPGIADAFNNWLDALGRLNAHLDAIYISMNRAQGAYQAGDKAAENAQVTAMNRYAAESARLLATLPKLRNAVFDKFVELEIPEFALNPGDFMKMLHDITVTGHLPEALAVPAAQLGMSQTQVEDYARFLVGADPLSGRGAFPQMLTNSVDAGSLASAAAALWFSAPVARNAGVSNGKIRFEVPTLPGYEYKIESAPSLSSANWSTELTTNTVSESFTFESSSLLKGAKFFRVRHD